MLKTIQIVKIQCPDVLIPFAVIRTFYKKVKFFNIVFLPPQKVQRFKRWQNDSTISETILAPFEAFSSFTCPGHGKSSSLANVWANIYMSSLHVFCCRHLFAGHVGYMSSLRLIDWNGLMFKWIRWNLYMQGIPRCCVRMTACCTITQGMAQVSPSFAHNAVWASAWD